MQSPEFEIRPFEALTIIELYELLALRAEVFVVEQNCVYQDIDGKDGKALHVLGKINGKVVAYARLFRPGDYFGNASIGRVVIAQEFRDNKWGYELMDAAIKGVSAHFSTYAITISAQLYLRRFYENNGFEKIGEPYLEDGIPHIEMCRR